MKIKLDTPESSNISSLAYDSDDETLTVEFKNGTAYDYHGVPAKVADEFAASDSKGKFLNQEIKGNYEYQKQ